MKYIIIGLGNFGTSLAERLTRTGNEVIGVDNKMTKVEALKENITHTVCLDCTDPQAVTYLPLKDTDVVIICIGENEGVNIMATALMKRLNVKRLIGRAVSPLHEGVLEAMGIEEFVHPEDETAERWAKKLNLKGVIDSFEVEGNYSIIEATVPKKYEGKTLLELDFGKNFNVVVLTTITITKQKNLVGISRKVRKAQGVATSKTVLNAGDIIVLYGDVKNIEKLLKED
ncbi:MAG: TrkA family potassium uptake protein [Lutibacter sp.]|jgi:trk system potassium uptake protein TrkA|uniref:potassium channel family protein n=1 Tax=Lutibacter sp. TaxID=1925666 RepID=UPI00299D039C|nr:TrkA family potassium uptake protein [Lutibacter sp.]MDX1829749.1 TrkA family potassium uptake protein [Lutibacter sp.]